MQKQTSKKILTTLIAAILLFPILSAAIPIATAIEPPTLSIYSGPVGTKVTVTVTNVTIGGLVKIYWDSVKAWDGKAGFLAEGYAVGPTATIKIVIPEAVAGDHYVIAKDVESGNSLAATFTVVPKIVLSPDYGVVGDTITVTGTGFAEESIILLSGIDGIITVPATVTTSALGSFTCTFKIPETSDAMYTVKATDEDGNFAEDDLDVGKYITLTPERGLVGTTVTVAGRGFAAEGTVDIRWHIGTGYVTLVNDYPIDENGDFSTTFKVPQVPDPTPPGQKYDVEAYDSAGGFATATFTVAEEASIMLSPDEGRAGALFNVIGEWFSADSDVTIIFDGEEVGTATTNEVGAFTAADLKVPDVSEGVYTVTATDEDGVSASATFTVLPPPVIVIRTRAAEYLQGDTMSIYGNCSEVPEVAFLLITDPNGVIFWGAQIGSASWMEIDGWYVLPYLYGGDGMMPLGFWPLPSDAPLGSWNFTAYDAGEEILDTNLFTVVERPTLEMILSRLDELDVKLSGLFTDTEGNLKAYIDTSLGPVLTDLDALDAKIVSLAGDVATISTAVGELEVKLDDIGLKVTSINGSVATIETDLGTIEGYVEDVDDGVATISTALGTVQADVSDVLDEFPIKVAIDMTPVWAALGLSLIAALSATYAAIMISRKIAG